MGNKLKIIFCVGIIMAFFTACTNNTSVSNNTKLNTNKGNKVSKNIENNAANIISASNSVSNQNVVTNQQVVNTVQSISNTDSEKNKASSNLSKKVIVIDPGHANRSNLEKEPKAPGSSELKIKDGGGAEGVATKTPEYKINMQVAIKLKSILENKNYTVVMTKTSDSESLGNVERAEIGNNANANLVIRIHADSSDSTAVQGASMLVPSPVNSNTNAIYSASKQYGTTILNIYTSELGIKNRGVQENSDMTGFNWSKVPVVLIEMGFLSNPDEDRFLSDSNNETKIANALADGICKAVY